MGHGDRQAVRTKQLERGVTDNEGQTKHTPPNSIPKQHYESKPNHPVPTELVTA